VTRRTPLTHRFIKVAEHPQTLFISFSHYFSQTKHFQGDFQPSLQGFQRFPL
jgi:hypothetical protein